MNSFRGLVVDYISVPISSDTSLMVLVVHLDLLMRALGRVRSTYISEFSEQTPELEVGIKPWNSTMKVGNISAGGTGV